MKGNGNSVLKLTFCPTLNIGLVIQMEGVSGVDTACRIKVE